MKVRRVLRFNLWLMLLMDAALVAGSYYLAYLIRFDFSIPFAFERAFVRSLPLVLAVKMLAFGYFHLYRGMWRYTSLVDLVNVVKAVLSSFLVLILVVLMASRFRGFPRSVFVIDCILTLVFIGGVRLAIRFYFARVTGVKLFSGMGRLRGVGTKLLIIGAGDAGEKVLREILDNPGLQFEPVGFLDDNPGKMGKAIHGVPVLGKVEEIGRISAPFDEVLIAIPSATGEQMRRIVAACESTGKRSRTVPGIGELIEGRVSVKTIREVTLADLLGREEVRIHQDEIARCLRDKRVLVTGAGGSIGSEIVRQVCRFEPKALGLMEVSELNLFKVEMECRQRFSRVPVATFLTDIRDPEGIDRVFAEFMPQVVFHAAAYKHVPIQELHPWEAVHNNVCGTRYLARATLKVKGERFVLVSTDKAVRPASVMGATKRVAEMLMESLNGLSGTRFMAVRFGNVVGSSGSAIPIFQEQISRGGPLTVTHPEVTRYFMSVHEASQLILQAGAMGEGGEIFILDMGKPIRIVELAQDLIRLHGFEPERDIPIEFIGLRPGEKLREDLITEGEGIVATAHEKILVLRGRATDPAWLNTRIDELLAVARHFDASAIKGKLQEIVPEYTPRGPFPSP